MVSRLGLGFGLALGFGMGLGLGLGLGVGAVLPPRSAVSHKRMAATTSPPNSRVATTKASISIRV
jgi:hypothetical protein